MTNWTLKAIGFATCIQVNGEETPVVRLYMTSDKGEEYYMEIDEQFMREQPRLLLVDYSTGVPKV